MTNTSSSGFAGEPPIASFLYRDMGTATSAHGKEYEYGIGVEPAAPGMPVHEVKELVNRTRAEAVAETEARLQRDYEARSADEAAKIRGAIELFQGERKSYFSRAEAEVVKLSLSIAAKILHRQAQVDPMLVAALVRVAVEKLHDGSSVSVRVSPTEAWKWKEYLANPLNGTTIEVVEDTHLGASDCILATDLGSANFSIEAQMKEVEQGFFDLLAQRPTSTPIPATGG